VAKHGTSIRGDLIRGAIAGGVGTWVMDHVTAAMLESSSAADRSREESARPRGQDPAANFADTIIDTLAIDATADRRAQAATIVHFGLGIVPGAAYGVLRNRVPFLGAARGLAYGALLFALDDEYLNTRLGLAAEPSAYPASSHVRGLAGHLVLGATTDTLCDVLGG
jgi:uncharacterized membrane protein YagU involved in acid resistance